MRFLLKSTLSLRDEFLPWFERRLMESTACSLDQSSHNKLLRFADQCAAVGKDALTRFPLCIDHVYVRGLVQSLSVRTRDLESNFPALKGCSSAMVELCRSLRQLLRYLAASAESLGRCHQRWEPVLRYLGELKEEVRKPLRNYLRGLEEANSEEQSGLLQQKTNTTSIAASMRQRNAAISRLQTFFSELSRPVVRTLALGHDIDLLLFRIDQELEPCHIVSNFLTSRAMITMQASLSWSSKAHVTREDMDRLHVIIKQLAVPGNVVKRVPFDTATRMNRMGAPPLPYEIVGGQEGKHTSKQLVELTIRQGTATLLESFLHETHGAELLVSMIMQLASMDITIPRTQSEGHDKAKDETATPNRLPEQVKVALQALKSLDIELIAACFQDWKERLQEQQSLRDTPDVAAFVQAQQSLAQAERNLALVSVGEQEIKLIHDNAAKRYLSCAERLSQISARVLQEEVVFELAPNTAESWRPVLLAVKRKLGDTPWEVSA